MEALAHLASRSSRMLGESCCEQLHPFLGLRSEGTGVVVQYVSCFCCCRRFTCHVRADVRRDFVASAPSALVYYA